MYSVSSVNVGYASSDGMEENFFLPEDDKKKNSEEKLAMEMVEKLEIILLLIRGRLMLTSISIYLGTIFFRSN